MYNSKLTRELHKLHRLRLQKALLSLKYLECTSMEELLQIAQTIERTRINDMREFAYPQEEYRGPILEYIQEERMTIDTAFQDLKAIFQQRKKTLLDQQTERTQLGQEEISRHQEGQAMETEAVHLVARVVKQAQRLQQQKREQGADPPQMKIKQEQGAAAYPETAEWLLEEIIKEIKTFQEQIRDMKKHLSDMRTQTGGQ